MQCLVPPHEDVTADTKEDTVYAIEKGLKEDSTNVGGKRPRVGIVRCCRRKDRGCRKAIGWCRGHGEVVLRVAIVEGGTLSFQTISKDQNGGPVGV